MAYCILCGRGILPDTFRVLDYSDWTEEDIRKEDLLRGLQDGVVTLSDFCNLFKTAGGYFVGGFHAIFSYERSEFSSDRIKFIRVKPSGLNVLVIFHGVGCVRLLESKDGYLIVNRQRLECKNLGYGYGELFGLSRLQDGGYAFGLTFCGKDAMFHLYKGYFEIGFKKPGGCGRFSYLPESVAAKELLLGGKV